MGIRERLEGMPPGSSVSVEWVLQQLDSAGDPEEVTTRGASDRLGRSVKFWRMAAESGAVRGAYRDSEDSPWRLPLAECRAHLLRLAHKRKGIRGPNRKTASAPPSRFRPPRLSEGPLLVGGHEAVERPALRLEESA
jgi:hypothetical protein